MFFSGVRTDTAIVYASCSCVCCAQDATGRGIFAVVSLSPGAGLLTGSATPRSYPSTGHYGCPGRADAWFGASQESARPESLTTIEPAAAQWLRVAARLAVSDCLVGRQLAVTWNETYGKDAVTLFKRLRYDGKCVRFLDRLPLFFAGVVLDCLNVAPLRACRGGLTSGEAVRRGFCCRG